MVTAEQFIKSYLSNKGDTPAIAKELGVTPPHGRLQGDSLAQGRCKVA